jgi:hypothetical protein
VAKQPVNENKPQAIMPKNSGGNNRNNEATRISKKINETNLADPDDGVNRTAPNGDSAPKKDDEGSKDNGWMRTPSDDDDGVILSQKRNSAEDQEKPIIGRWIARKRNTQQSSGPIIPELAQLKARGR